MLISSSSPIWVNILLFMLVFFTSIQVYWFYLDHQFLLDTGITVEGAPNLNIIYMMAGQLLATVAATVLVLVTQNPRQYLVVLLISILREGQEMVMDPPFSLRQQPSLTRDGFRRSPGDCRAEDRSLRDRSEKYDPLEKQTQGKCFMLRQANFAITLAAALTIGTAAVAQTDLDIKFAGALEFADDGTLFVGDNYNGAIYAFEMPATGGPAQIMANSIANIDAKSPNCWASAAVRSRLTTSRRIR